MNNITKVFALGGLEEVGKNTHCIEHNEELIIVDVGLKFAKKSMSGINGIIPDYSYLEKNCNKIKAIFITHGHEDHIGGIPYILKKINIPFIYAPKLASDLIKLKLKRANIKNVKIIEYNENSTFKFKYFKISFFNVTHSIPNSFGIYIKTPNGGIVNTGDFKIDLTPLGNKTGFININEIRKQGVTILLSDSTNAEFEGSTLTETKIIENLNNLFLKTKKRILITTFASNVNRIYQIILSAQKIKRKVAIAGRSIENIIEIVKNRKYLILNKNLFVPLKNIYDFKPEEIIILCTGSQGETNSVITKIANNEHPIIKEPQNNVIIFSSRPIPGNRYSVEFVINKLKKLGVQVELNSPFKSLHTSGHARQYEQKLIIALLKPKYFIPIHGEYRMLKIHGKTAISTGIPKENVFVLKNGDQIYMENEKAWKANSIDVQPVFIGNNFDDICSLEILRDREIMSKYGVLSCAIVIDLKNKKLINFPSFKAKGNFYFWNEIKFKKLLTNNTQKIIENFLKNKKYLKETLLKIIKDNIEEIIFQEKKINPIVCTMIIEK